MRTTFTRLLGLCLLLVLGATFGSIASAAERVTWYHHDLQGSPVAATDRNGAVVWREQYRPYGQRTLKEDGGSNKLWYTGKAHEEGTRLSYFGARWYHPEIGRFMSVDPVDFTEDNVQSFNRYAYANNNPYRYVDPDGQSPKDVWLQRNGLNFMKLDAGYGPGIGAGGGSGVRGTSASRGARTDAEFNAAVEREVTKGAAGGERAGKPFTRAGKAEVKADNAAAHGGQTTCANCGQPTVPGQQSRSGVTPPKNETHVDHIIPKSKGGNGSPDNGQVLCRDCNLRKGAD